MKTLVITTPINGFARTKKEMEDLSKTVARSVEFPVDYNKIAAEVVTQTALECKAYVLRAIEQNLIIIPEGSEFNKEAFLGGDESRPWGLLPWVTKKNISDSLKFLAVVLFWKGIEKGVKDFVGESIKANLNLAWMEKIEPSLIALMIFMKMRKK